ncbi:MAG: hypothetical protein ACOYH4_00555 [Saccharofermentanales bacterium]|jgi:hypothetical protein
MDIKKMIDDLVQKIKGDQGFADQFKKDPIKAVEKTIGVDLPDEQIKSVVDGVKAKLKLDDAGDVVGKVKGIFGK